MRKQHGENAPFSPALGCEKLTVNQLNEVDHLFYYHSPKKVKTMLWAYVQKVNNPLRVKKKHRQLMEELLDCLRNMEQNIHPVE